MTTSNLRSTPARSWLRRSLLAAALALPDATGAAAAPADPLPELRITMVHAGQRRPVSTDGRGKARLYERLWELYPRPGGGGVGRPEHVALTDLVEELYHPEVQLEMRRVASLSGPRPFTVELHLADQAAPIWTHASFQERVLRSGASNMERRRRRAPWFPAAAFLLHEAAHLGDASTCARGYRFGPDGQHKHEEVVSAASAFKEGWADYQASHSKRAHFGDGEPLRAPAATLEIEAPDSRPAGEPRTGVYLPLPPAIQTSNDRLSNEGWVAHILHRMRRDLEPGRAGMEQAFRDTQARDCRTLATFAAAYAKAFPQARESLRELLLEELGGGLGWKLRGPQAALILDEGFLPNCQGNIDAPRSGPDDPRQVKAEPGGPAWGLAVTYAAHSPDPCLPRPYLWEIQTPRSVEAQTLRALIEGTYSSGGLLGQ